MRQKQRKNRKNVSLRQNGVGTGFVMADAILPKGHILSVKPRYRTDTLVFIERWIRIFPKHGIALSSFSLAHFEYLPNILPRHPRQFLHLYYIARLAHLSDNR